MTISHRSKLLILLVVLISLSTGVLAANYVEKRIQSTGTIYTPNPSLEVYSDPGCTTILTQVNWGTLTAGDAPTYTIYIKNIGNAQLQVNITTANWTPTEAPTYINLTSNVNNFALPPDSTQTAILTLTISSSIQGITDFSFDIVVEGS